MKLSGRQMKQIHDALLSGYDASTLRMMLRMELDLDLVTIAGGDNYSLVVFNLIDWAEKKGKVLELVDVAHEHNKGNALLAILTQQAPNWPALGSTTPQTSQPTGMISSNIPNWQKAGIELVKIPAGEFLYGEEKVSVYLDEFWIGRTPVTNRQYQVFVDATIYSPPQHWDGKRVHPAKMNHPVVNVCWTEAQAFCEWAGVFLPTEQQWEKAARGTDGREYPWGNKEPGP